MNKSEKTERRRQEDIILNKVLLWCGGAAVLELLLLAVKRFNITPAVSVMLKVLLFLGLLLAAVAVYKGRKNKKAGVEAIFPYALCVFSLALAACSAAVWAYAPIANGLVYLVLAGAVLSILYYLYQREFFLMALLCGVGTIGLWLLLHEGKTPYVYAALGMAGVLILAVAALTCVLQKNGGVLTINGRARELLTKNANYALVYVTCGLMAAVLLVALTVGAAVGVTVYYGVPVAWVLIMAVYYTVKLM